jgi:hypothetical protein
LTSGKEKQVAVGRLACEAKPPGVKWLSDGEEAAEVAAPHVPVEALVDDRIAQRRCHRNKFTSEMLS